MRFLEQVNHDLEALLMQMLYMICYPFGPCKDISLLTTEEWKGFSQRLFLRTMLYGMVAGILLGKQLQENNIFSLINP